MLTFAKVSGYFYFPISGQIDVTETLKQTLQLPAAQSQTDWMTLLEHLPKEAVQQLAHAQENAKKSGNPQSFCHSIFDGHHESQLVTHFVKWVPATPEKEAHFIGVLRPSHTDKASVVDLLKQVEMYQTIVESQSIFLVRTDLEGAYTFTNQTFLNFFGFEEEEVLGQSYLLTVHPDDHASCLKVGEKCLQFPDKAHSIVMRKPDKLGNYYWSKWEFKAIKDEKGDFHEVQCIGIDVSAQMKVQQELKAQSEAAQKQNTLLESILESIQDGVVVCNNEGDFLVFNTAAKRYLGVGAIETSPERWQEDYGIFHPDQHTPFAQADLPMSRGIAGETVRNLELFIKNPSYPEGRFLNSHATPIRNSKGQQIGAVGVLHDIDNLRRLNEGLESEISIRSRELHASEARYRMLAENSRDLISLHQLDGTYQYVSESCEALLGYSREELIGKNPYLFIHPEDRAHIEQDLHQELLGGRERFGRIEYRFKHKEGHYVWIEALTQPIMDAQGKPIQLQSTSRDITHRKQVEDRIKQALNKEHELGELKSQLVSMASHQLRTPISILQSNLELIQLKLEQQGMKESMETNLERMFRQVNRMTQLVENVLTLSRIESNQVKLNPEPIWLSALLGELIEQIPTESAITLEVRGEEHPINGDPQMLVHAIGNLLNNAAKYSADAPKPPHVQLVYRDRGIDLIIKDFGIGISVSDQHQLFEPFFRGRNALNKPGTGLGLLIARDIINRHHGAIHVESKLGAGTQIWVFLPASLMVTD